MPGDAGRGRGREANREGDGAREDERGSARPRGAEKPRWRSPPPPVASAHAAQRRHIHRSIRLATRAATVYAVAAMQCAGRDGARSPGRRHARRPTDAYAPSPLRDRRLLIDRGQDRTRRWPCVPPISKPVRCTPSHFFPCWPSLSSVPVPPQRFLASDPAVHSPRGHTIQSAFPYCNEGVLQSKEVTEAEDRVLDQSRDGGVPCPCVTTMGNPCRPRTHRFQSSLSSLMRVLLP